MRSLLTRRALGLGLVAAALMGAMIAMGLWQLGVYDDRQRDDAQERARQQPVPLDDVLGPDSAFPAGATGRPVIVKGRYRAAEQIYVRDLAGADAPYAVVTPLLTDRGSAVLVVRGSADRPDGSPRPPSTTVEVTGLLQPSQSEGAALSRDRVTSGLRIAAVVRDFREDLYAGYLVLTASDPAESLPPVEAALPQPSRLTGLRNLLYALQWWVFAGFVAFMWWRIVAEPASNGVESDPSASGGAPGGDRSGEPVR